MEEIDKLIVFLFLRYYIDRILALQLHTVLSVRKRVPV